MAPGRTVSGNFLWAAEQAAPSVRTHVAPRRWFACQGSDVNALPEPESDMTEVTVWSLEQHTRADLRPNRSPARSPLLHEARRPAPAGYFELEQQAAGTVELAYFGLGPGFAGEGLGGWLLTRALEHAWCLDGTERVWVHTCSLDGPGALPNYRARGMVPFAEHTEWRQM